MDDRRATSANGSHHEVLRRTHALEVQDDLGANQAIGRARMEVSVIDIELHAERLETRDVHVEFARANLASAWHCHDSATEPGNERAKNRNGSTHLGDELIRGSIRVEIARVDEKSMAVLPASDAGANGRQNVTHNVYVRDKRHVSDARLTRRHHACRHKLEN